MPKSILDLVHWRNNETVEMKVSDGKIIIEKVANEHKSIDELFANYDGKYTPVEINWGEPVGKEIW